MLNELSYKKALMMVTQRQPLPPPADGRAQKMLVVLPHDGTDQERAWRLVKALDVRPEDLNIVSVSDAPVTAPSSFIRRVRYLRSGDMSMTGLPKRKFLDEIWDDGPRIAIDLNRTFHLPAALIVGASPAAQRIGFFDERADPFYDCLLVPEQSTAQAITVLKEYLAMISPALVRTEKEISYRLVAES